MTVDSKILLLNECDNVSISSFFSKVSLPKIQNVSVVICAVGILIGVSAYS